MKTILCYGDSNLWGFIPGSYNDVTCLAERYPKAKRWPGVMQRLLGDTYDVVEAGINGRTTSLDELTPGRPYRNGLKDLSIFLETHYPIDLIIFWLGTNDTKKQYQRIVPEIAEGMQQLIRFSKASNKGPNGAAPKILIIAPQHISKSANLHEQYDDAAIEKSKQLASAYQQLAQTEACEFLDAAQFVSSSPADGIHLDETQCKIWGQVLAEKVQRII